MTHPFARASLVALLLLPAPASTFAAEHAARVFDFSGVWNYMERADILGGHYVVQYRYSIWQKGRRLCGALERSGAPNRRIELYVFKGVAHRSYADIWMDAGSPRDAHYVPAYPFAADDVLRLRLRGKTLIMGEPYSPQGGGVATVLPPDKDIIYLDRFPLSRQPEPAELEALGAEEGVGKAFLEKCLSDEGHAQENE